MRPTPTGDYERAAAMSALHPAAQCVVLAFEQLRREFEKRRTGGPKNPRGILPIEAAVDGAISDTIAWLMGEQEPSDG